MRGASRAGERREDAIAAARLGPAESVGGRIIAVCDAFDVMVSGRPYRSAITAGNALDELRRCAETQLDPPVVEAFCALAAEHAEVTA